MRIENFKMTIGRRRPFWLFPLRGRSHHNSCLGSKYFRSSATTEFIRPEITLHCAASHKAAAVPKLPSLLGLSEIE